MKIGSIGKFGYRTVVTGRETAEFQYTPLKKVWDTLYGAGAREIPNDKRETEGSLKRRCSLSRACPRDHGSWPRPAVWSGEPQLLIHRRRNNPDHPTDISDRYRTSETGQAKSQS